MGSQHKGTGRKHLALSSCKKVVVRVFKVPVHAQIHVTRDVVEKKSQTVPYEDRIVSGRDRICKIIVYNSIDTIF